MWLCVCDRYKEPEEPQGYEHTPVYGEYKGPQQRAAYVTTAFNNLLHTMLVYGSGLYVGPDSDGMLNLCEDTLVRTPPAAQVCMQQE